ncbi:MAG: hypothetical protein RJA22_2116 [Verrucomicrobiota bacterium]|jgi:signal transduction histidine kinase
MKIPPVLRTPALILGVLLLLGALVWTETHMWSRIDRMRDRPAVTATEVESLHRLQTWSSAVLLGVGAGLAVLLYRGLIAPLQERLRQSQRVIERQEKLSSLGVLAAGIAHEIRNPLTSIRVRLFTQQALLKPGSEEHEDNVFLTGEIARLERIVKDFLAFARPADPQPAPLPASRPLREVAPLLAPELRKSGIVLREEYLADPVVQADAGQIKQVLINLVRNAADAITGTTGASPATGPAERGTITLRTRTEIRRRRGGSASWAILEVADTGPGIPPEVQGRLFDPFFTTKASGTGLGLSMALRIVEKHGGLLEYSTAPGRGTLFRIVLPLQTP